MPFQYGATDAKHNEDNPVDEEQATTNNAYSYQQQYQQLLQDLGSYYHPSPHSTDRPVLNSTPSSDSSDYEEYEYQAELHGNTNNNINATAPLIQMSVSNSSLQHLLEQGDDEYIHSTSRKKYNKNQRQWVLLGAIVLLLLIGGGTWHLGQSRPSSSDHAPPPSHTGSSSTNNDAALSRLHPVVDLGVPCYTRPNWSSPNRALFGKNNQHDNNNNNDNNHAIPTNAWYQNLLLLPQTTGPKPEQRVYPMPYLVDVVGRVPGMQLHPAQLFAGAEEVHVSANPAFGLTMGAAASSSSSTNMDHELSHLYNITHMTALGITLEWTSTDNNLVYSSSLVRGMPYGTVRYQYNHYNKNDNANWLPTVATDQTLRHPPKVDGVERKELDCTNTNHHHKSGIITVQRELEMTFVESDYTWLVFVSRPVQVHCGPGGNGVVFQFGLADDDDDLVLRAALVDGCTTGTNPVSCSVDNKPQYPAQDYAQLLRHHANWYPGPNTKVSYEYDHGKDSRTTTRLTFDWDVQSMNHNDEESNDDDNGGLIMYALPHHQDLIQETMLTQQQQSVVLPETGSGDLFCQTSLIGSACVVVGSSWMLHEHVTAASFRAPRPPRHSALPELIRAYQQDLAFALPRYYQRGAGDTYFSGKQLAKLARILTIGEELQELCSSNSLAPPNECQSVPSRNDPDFQNAVQRLRDGVEIWINGNAETPFVYDNQWGGIVSCGCDFDDKRGTCRNSFPECPGFDDPGLNFGNAFYNDHHFHYGYHVYAAAAVARFDPEWGRANFQNVLLLIRDYANPSKDDKLFPVARHKDFYQGNSWAGGISWATMNGRNQESSSEAIAAYEAVALYGQEMIKTFENHDQEQAQVARQIAHFGQYLTASELRSADRYWHVVHGRSPFPDLYTRHVVGILWNTMAQFQTWFGSAPHLVYGIQLLPLTAVSEQRDGLEWAREIYPEFSDGCEASHQDCQAQGWSVLVYAMLATVGHQDEAAQNALQLPSDVFDSAGGNGHSLTNTLWYLATRKEVEHPLDIKPKASPKRAPLAGTPDETDHEFPKALDCGCPETCTKEALNQMASDHSCGDRISWLISAMDKTQQEACAQVSGVEYPEDCGSCDPQRCSNGASVQDISNSPSNDDDGENTCPPCSREICQGELNRCQVHLSPYLCINGPGTGGCSMTPWMLEEHVCTSCCILSSNCGH